MFPNVDEMPIVPDILENVKYLFDAVYNPAPTKLINTANSLGVKTLGGMSMLVHQAIMAEMLWNDIQISDNIAKTVEKEALAVLNEALKEI
jgi:shikimate 5-dehydrogenase